MQEGEDKPKLNWERAPIYQHGQSLPGYCKHNLDIWQVWKQEQLSGLARTSLEQAEKLNAGVATKNHDRICVNPATRWASLTPEQQASYKAYNSRAIDGFGAYNEEFYFRAIHAMRQVPTLWLYFYVLPEEWHMMSFRAKSVVTIHNEEVKIHRSYHQ